MLGYGVYFERKNIEKNIITIPTKEKILRNIDLYLFFLKSKKLK